jgi:hypothetical protein
MQIYRLISEALGASAFHLETVALATNWQRLADDFKGSVYFGRKTFVSINDDPIRMPTPGMEEFLVNLCCEFGGFNSHWIAVVVAHLNIRCPQMDNGLIASHFGGMRRTSLVPKLLL